MASAIFCFSATISATSLSHSSHPQHSFLRPTPRNLAAASRQSTHHHRRRPTPPIRANLRSEQQNIAVTVGEERLKSDSEGDRRIKEIVVVGGGTSGWMTASYLAKALGETAKITVLQAPEVSSLGVGESTVPDLQRAFFNFLEIPETEWMPECKASYKMAVKYINWNTPGSPSPFPRRLNPDPTRNVPEADYSYNIFARLERHHGIPLPQYWVYDLLDPSTPTPPPYMYACYYNALAIDGNRSPRHLDGSPALPTAWHFDASLIADYLRRYSTSNLGVHHVQEKMVKVEMDPLLPDHIQAIHTAAGRRISADLFIDCTGFRGLLINGVLNEPFLASDKLLCDAAVATQVLHDDRPDNVEPYTTAIAMDAGWTWKIPLLGRFGTGYVYSSDYTTEEKAAEDLIKLWNLDEATTKLNKIKFRVGRNQRAWVGNVVSIGAASCFLEPLESTGIYFIYTALYHLLQSFPDKDFREGCARRFNDDIQNMFLDMQDFLQVHFCFSPRTDTAFWRASAELEAKLSDRGKRLMEVYKAGLVMFPEDVDVISAPKDGIYRPLTLFTNNHFYNVIAAAGLLPESPDPRLRHMPEAVASARKIFEGIKTQQTELLEKLPSCYDYLRRLHKLEADGGAAKAGGGSAAIAQTTAGAAK